MGCHSGPISYPSLKVCVAFLRELGRVDVDVVVVGGEGFMGS